MFTVKHIFQADETGPHVENLYQASDVQFTPDIPPDQSLGALQLRSGDVFVAGLWGGVAYVMNEAGKTVARYELPKAGPAHDGPMLFVDPCDYQPDDPEAYAPDAA